MSAPAWLETMLNTAFFTMCPVHSATARSECNMYCLECEGGALCSYCRASHHSGHRVIQIRRSSYRDVVRVAEIQASLDIREVQTYVINSARVLFLKERPPPKPIKGLSGHACRVCHRNLLNSFRFCSLECKLAGLKTDKDFKRLKKQHRVIELEEERCPRSSTSRSRRRKGVPRRASFGS